MRRWMLPVLAGLLAAPLLACPAIAQDYPTKVVRLLVPYPAGGAVDIVGRILGQQLSQYWHQQVVVENRPGAGGVIASELLAKSPADGYTLILVSSGHAANPLLYRKLPYDTVKDFTAISEVAASPNILLVNNAFPAKTVGELLALARAQPGKLTYGMAGNGTSAHLAGELFKYLAHVDIAAAAYKGGAPSLNDVIAGEIPMSFNNVPESIGQIRAGTVRALAVTTATRSPALPDIPTIAEAGVPGYETGVWWGVLGPAGLPQPVVDKIHDDLVRALGADMVKQRLAELGAVPIGNRPLEFEALIRAETEKWAPVIETAGIHLE